MSGEGLCYANGFRWQLMAVIFCASIRMVWMLSSIQLVLLYAFCVM